jgi:hypothetical protein
MEWLLIDGIGPFFHGYQRKRINWSKIPFAHLETPAGLKPELLAPIREEFARFVSTAAAVGFNAVTLDDLAHLYIWQDYAPPLQALLRHYQTLYRELFALAAQAGLRVFITTDVMFYTPELKRALGRSTASLILWWQQALRHVFHDFPDLAGIIMRFGEADGVDVKHTFRSELVLRTPSQVRQFLSQLLPVFEQCGKLLIFRTWSVGAHPVGDLMWHHGTFHKVFASLRSPQLIISMKYGESDFFRFLPLNAHFFQDTHKKIIELQTRREYEGFGEYPAFVGWEYERYLQTVRQLPHVVGASVWCQTGGWGTFRRRTYLANSSIWVELNTFVTVQMCRGASCEQAVEQFCARSAPVIAAQPFLEFLRLADEVIANLLYIRELGERTLFFRRLRVPPLLHVFWDRLLMTPWIRTALRCLVADHQRAVAEGWHALETLHTMQQVAEAQHLPNQGLQLQYDTFELLASVREYFFGEATPALQERVHALHQRYRATYRQRYTIHTTEAPGVLHSRYVPVLLRLLLRQQRGYRLIDHLLMLQLLTLAYPFLRRWSRWLFPPSTRTHGMGIEAVLK